MIVAFLVVGHALRSLSTSVNSNSGSMESRPTESSCRRWQLHYFISSTERLRLISRVIFRCMCAGMPVIRRGKIFPLSVTNFFSKSGFL